MAETLVVAILALVAGHKLVEEGAEVLMVEQQQAGEAVVLVAE